MKIFQPDADSGDSSFAAAENGDVEIEVSLVYDRDVALAVLRDLLYISGKEQDEADL